MSIPLDEPTTGGPPAVRLGDVGSGVEPEAAGSRRKAADVQSRSPQPGEGNEQEHQQWNVAEEFHIDGAGEAQRWQRLHSKPRHHNAYYNGDHKRRRHQLNRDHEAREELWEVPDEHLPQSTHGLVAFTQQVSSQGYSFKASCRVIFDGSSAGSPVYWPTHFL